MLFLGFCWYMRILHATRHMGRGNTEKFQFTCSYYILYPHDLDIQTKDEFWMIFISFQSCFSPFPDTIQLWLGFTRNLETLDLNSDKSDRSIFLKVSETVFIFSFSLPLRCGKNKLKRWIWIWIPRNLKIIFSVSPLSSSWHCPVITWLIARPWPRLCADQAP